MGLSLGSSGASWGSLERPDALLRAGEKLVLAGASAIAVVARFPDDPDSEALAAYRHGAGVDGLAGAEAVISHLLVRHLGIPCAHAPALQPLPMDPDLDPRAAAEELGHTFLPCVLVGLSRAPDLVPLGPAGHPYGDGIGLGPAGTLLTAAAIGAVVAPAGALGGEAVLACAERGIPVIAVHNPCLLEVSAQALGLEVLAAASYAEAAGLVLALREDRSGCIAAAAGGTAQRRQAIGWRLATPRALATLGWQTEPSMVLRPETSSGRSVTASTRPRPAMARM